MNQDARQKLWRRVVAALALALALAAIAGVIALAEFTSSEKAKRVLAAYPSDSIRFSSNYMKKWDEDEDANKMHTFISTIFVPENAATNAATWDSVVVSVSNYDQSNPADWNKTTDTYYTLTAELVTLSSSGTGYTIGTHDPGYSDYATITPSGSIGTQKKLEASTASAATHNYTINFKNAMLGSGKYLMLTATPENSALPTLTILLNVKTRGETGPTTEWALTLDENDAKPIGDYYGYNYRLSGVGTGTMTLSWNNDAIHISKIFLREVSQSVSDSVTGTVSIGFPVDAENRNSYGVTFFPVSENAPTAWPTPTEGTAPSGGAGNNIYFSFSESGT